MSKMTPTGMKAYQEFIVKHELKPALSAYPIMYFMDKEGEEHAFTMSHILKDVGYEKTSSGSWVKSKRKKGEE